MKDLDDNNPNDADDLPKKGKNVAPAKYKSMLKKPAQESLMPDTVKDEPKQKPILVEKADGSIGQWGNDIAPAKPVVPPAKKKSMLSEKSRGLDNSYNATRDQQKGKSVETIHPSYKY